MEPETDHIGLGAADVPTGMHKPAALLFWALPALALAGSLWLWHSVRVSDSSLAGARFERQSEYLWNDVRTRLGYGDRIMRGCAGLFAASEDVTRSEWRAYVGAQRTAEYFPGIKALGYAERVPGAVKAAHISRRRSEGMPSYKISPEGERAEYAPVVYSHPMPSASSRGFGYDLLTEPALRAAMRAAGDSGGTAISGPARAGAGKGFLMFVPVYAKGASEGGPAQRRPALQGYIFCVVDAGELAEYIVSRAGFRIGLRIYDGSERNEAGLLYDSSAAPGAEKAGASPEFSRTIPVRLYGRDWTVELSALPSFGSSEKKNHLLILLSGLTISALLAWLVAAQEARRRALAAAESTSQALRLTKFAVDNAGEAFFLIGAGGLIEYVNNSGCRLLGYERKDLKGLNVAEINPYYSTNEPWIMNWEKFKLKKQEVFEAELKAADGHLVPVEISDGYLVQGGREYMAAFVRDLAGRKRTERELLGAKADAEAASRAKGVFLASMSHEIRTPLNAIMGFSQLMLRDPELSPRQSRQLEIINRSGSHLLALINDILEMSRIDAGRAALNVTAFDPRLMLRDIESMFRQRAEARGLTLAFEAAPGLPAFVKADEGKLRQILVNLLGNALKFTAEGGIKLRASAAAQSLVFEVEDTGPGMEDEETSRLFSPFEQTKAGAAAGTGTGLGLVISREYARLMGGDISVWSSPGKGSSFRAEVKYAAAEAPAENIVPRRVKKLSPGRQPVRVLVADDKDDNREFLTQLLTVTGFEVRSAVNGVEALKEYSAWHPHLILMDIKMPELNGYEASRRLRSTGGGAEVKIIMLSASTLGDIRKEALASGADDYLSKPFKEADLFARIADQLGVEYEYEDEAVPVPAGRAPAPGLRVELPAETARQLREAALRGDFEKAAELVAAAGLSPADAALFRETVERFDAAELLRLTGDEK